MISTCAALELIGECRSRPHDQGWTRAHQKMELDSKTAHTFTHDCLATGEHLFRRPWSFGSWWQSLLA